MIDFTAHPLFIIKNCRFNYEEMQFFINNITKYTNIDFSITSWPPALGDINLGIYKNDTIVKHLADNIINLNVEEQSKIDNKNENYTLLQKVLNNNNTDLIYYVVDAGCNLYLDIYKKFMDSIHLLSYLKDFQLYIFNNFIFKDTNFIFKNTHKYYYMIQTMLLIIKHQKVMPNVLIKFKIIPFIYS